MMLNEILQKLHDNENVLIARGQIIYAVDGVVYGYMVQPHAISRMIPTQEFWSLIKAHLHREAAKLLRNGKFAKCKLVLEEIISLPPL